MTSIYRNVNYSQGGLFIFFVGVCGLNIKTALFRGINSLSIDAKGRMAIPSRYRKYLQAFCDGELIITIDPEHCLLIYPLPEWEVIEQKLNALPTLNKQVRKLQRLLIGHATEVQIDNNGRILVPSTLRAFAGVEKKVVLVGQGNKFELWDEVTWNQCREEWLEESIEGLPPELGSLSL